MYRNPLKIGVVDSGISSTFLRSTSVKVSAGAFFSLDFHKKTLNTFFCDGSDISSWREGVATLGIDDKSGHGTAVTSIIYRNIPVPVEFYIAKILDEQQSGSALCLLAALHWLINDVKADCVNLSLGTDNWKVRRQMLELVEQAGARGCMIFSAAGDVPTLPSELTGVTAVGISRLSRNNNVGVKLDCIALPSTVEIFQGNGWTTSEISTSYACPLVLSEYCAAMSR